MAHYTAKHGQAQGPPSRAAASRVAARPADPARSRARASALVSRLPPRAACGSAPPPPQPRRAVQRHILATKGLSPPFSVSAVSAAFTRAIIGLDAELRQQPEHVSGHDQSGTTLTMVALTPTDIICANTGDSRSVLSRAGAAIDLSNDHKPFLEEEKTRIERAGGHVKFNRVNGDLAVSRALGDFAYKQVRRSPARPLLAPARRLARRASPPSRVLALTVPAAAALTVPPRARAAAPPALRSATTSRRRRRQ